MIVFKCIICDDISEAFQHPSAIECGKALRRERDTALGKLQNIKEHIQFMRHDEMRHKEVGKEKVAWDKLNGPLSAIERLCANPNFPTRAL